MASTITLPVFGSSPTQRQDRTFTPSGPATRTFLPYKVSFSGGALDPALPARKLRSLIGYSSHTEPVSLHSGNSHFLRRVLVHSLTPQVESSSETKSETTFEPEYLDPPKETLNIGVLEVKTSSKPARTSKKGRNPKLLNSLASQRTTTLDYSQILKYPIVTEAGMKNILQKNTLVFAVDKRADKTIIKDSASKIFKIKIKKVNTSILPDGTKKAFLILAPDQSAVDVAKRIKVI
ncbi:PREDICTED: 60S ribosomal protein L23A-like [Ipomoea nil]|uniref:60S ribosomal protein L23A-like n=1 Tax=Ipomoea nil TaxID=35883 RepID=UPI00090179F1|nr:PREDICTED: 60S ribosomal protein L23A-like [Ipomoea nil]